MSALLEVVALVKSFRTDGVERPVLRGLSIAVDRGSWIAVMGPSGCGKSTMLHLLGGLDLPDSGSISIAGEEITILSSAERVLRRRRVGYLFQKYNLLPHLGVTANVEHPQRLAGVAPRVAKDRSRELLDLASGPHRSRECSSSLRRASPRRTRSDGSPPKRIQPRLGLVAASDPRERSHRRREICRRRQIAARRQGVCPVCTSRTQLWRYRDR